MPLPWPSGVSSAMRRGQFLRVRRHQCSHRVGGGTAVARSNRSRGQGSNRNLMLLPISACSGRALVELAQEYVVFLNDKRLGESSRSRIYVTPLVFDAGIILCARPSRGKRWRNWQLRSAPTWRKCQPRRTSGEIRQIGLRFFRPRLAMGWYGAFVVRTGARVP